MENTFFDKTFRDDEGNLVIWQKPNLPILIGLTATVLKFFPAVIENNVAYPLVDAVAFGTLFTWAWMELFQGVNYFRRSLGLLVLLGVIALRL